MKRTRYAGITAIIGASIVFSSCIGSFGVWNQVKNWNDSIENKGMRKFLFYSARIIPVYEICYMTDVAILNPIEYWNGMNPIAEAESIQIMRNRKGEYTIITTNKGYTIIKKGEEDYPIALTYDAKWNTWKVDANGKKHYLTASSQKETITISLEDGTDITLNLKEEGKNTIVLGKDQILIK